jgi:hypothetical protein
MVDVDVPTISIIVACAGILIAATYYILQIRYQTRLRQTDMVMRLYNTFGSTEFQKAYVKTHSLEFKNYADYEKKCERDMKVQVASYSVCVYFEGIGVLLHRKLINLDVVDDLLSTPIIWTWKRLEPMIISWREHANRPQIWEWFEYLYNEMKNREQKLHQKGVESG